MKKLLSAAAIAAFPFGALAADLPKRVAATAPAPMMVAAHNWTGVYVGVQGGYSWGTHEHYYSSGKYGDGSISGALVGGTAGANYHFPSSNLVIGIEGDLSVSTASATFSGTCMQENGLNGSLVVGGYCRTDVDWLATVRARAGFSLGSALIYATGGLAIADIVAKRPYDVSTTSNFQSTSKVRTGYVVGVGVEYALNQNWSAKLEYLYADFGKKNHYYGFSGALDHPLAYSTSIVRVGLNYKFGGSAAPVVARY